MQSKGWTFLQNIFKAFKKHVVLTECCQFYGFPLRTHIISAQSLADFLGATFGKKTWDVNGSS